MTAGSPRPSLLLRHALATAFVLNRLRIGLAIPSGQIGPHHLLLALADPFDDDQAHFSVNAGAAPVERRTGSWQAGAISRGFRSVRPGGGSTHRPNRPGDYSLPGGTAAGSHSLVEVHEVAFRLFFIDVDPDGESGQR